MFHGRNTGKKMNAMKIVEQAFDIINLMTDKNPIQILADAVANAGPREDSTRIGTSGVVRRQAVDVSPLPAGIYLYRVETVDGALAHGKLVCL